MTKTPLQYMASYEEFMWLERELKRFVGTVGNRPVDTYTQLIRSTKW